MNVTHRPRSGRAGIGESVLAPPSHSVRSLVRIGTPRIGRPDSEFILGSLLAARRHELYATREPLDPEVADEFDRLAGAVESGTPVEYLVHKAVFMDLELYVDERVLIPRAETEELVARSVARLRMCGGRHPVLGKMRCLDLGTGSGAIAIALARALPDADVVAGDVSPAALEVARVNLSRFNLSERIELTESDLFSGIHGLFDLIVSNPPYVPTARWERLDPSVRLHEPRLALDAGADGMACIRAILEQGPAFLAPGGSLAMEIDPALSPTVRRLAPGATVEQDWQGLDRFSFLRAAGNGR